jgi:hypothetical protein
MPESQASATEIRVAEEAEDMVTDVVAPKDKVKAKRKTFSILLLYLGDRIWLPPFRGLKFCSSV